MIDVSTYFTSKINSDDAKQWCCRLKFGKTIDKMGSDYVDLFDDDIIENTLSITSQSTSNSSFAIGGVCSKELDVTINAIGVAKLRKVNYLNKGIAVSVDVWLKTDDSNQADSIYLNTDGSENTTGKVHLGYFYISTVSNSDFQCVLKAYDGMLRLDKELTSTIAYSLQNGPRTTSEWLPMILSSATSDYDEIVCEDGIEDLLINNQRQISVDSIGNSNTYRTVLGYISILEGGFFEISPDNKLRLSRYSSESVYTEAHDRVLEYSFEDEAHTIGTVSTYVAGFKVESSLEVLPDNPATIYFDENNFLRGIQTEDTAEVDEDVTTFVTNIGNQMFNLDFLGGSVTIPNRPDLELGDKISVGVRTVIYNIDGSHSVTDKTYEDFLICKHIWTYITSSKLTSNAYSEQSSQGSSSSFKTASGGGGSSKATNAVYYALLDKDMTISAGTNSKVLECVYLMDANINTHLAVFIKCEVAHVNGTTVTLMLGDGTTRVFPNPDKGTIKCKVVYNNVDYYCEPEWDLSSGTFVLSFDLVLDGTEEDQQSSVNIYLYATDCNISIAAYDAQVILTANGIKEKKSDWTGRFEVSDKVSNVKLGIDSAPIITLSPSVVVNTSFE